MKSKMTMFLSKQIKKIAFVCSCLSLLGAMNAAKANNLSITKSSVSGSNITFTVYWENSWKNNSGDNPDNYDAVWVFVKYSDCNTPGFGWNHVKLSPVSGNHTAGSPLTVDAVSDSNGVFLRRSAIGTGKIDSVQVTLKMVTPATAGAYSFRVFGVEMVNITQGDFYVGDGISASTFNTGTKITSASQSGGVSAATLGGGASAVPAAYPMGWNSFYCMKYEITQEQYVDFLNTLTYDQQATRTVAVPNSVVGTQVMGGNAWRNDITISLIGSVNPAKYPATYKTGSPYVACNNLNLADLEAYLDWACLRPMTELEFEKICRGPLLPIDRELVCGVNSQIAPPTQARATYNYSWVNPNTGINNPNTATETSKTAGSGLYAYGNTWNYSSMNYAVGPLRVGFAATATTTRAQSGAAYYGVMDMGGNIWERVVNVNANGVKYTGVLGDGVLNASGNSDVSNWPASNGIGYRGGSWYDAAQYLQTSDRTYWNSGDAGRSNSHGGRGVR